VKAGTVAGARERRRRALESRAFSDRVGATAPRDLDLHLVVPDAAATPLLARPRFPPTSASRLDPVERRFAPLTRRRPRRGVFTGGTPALEEATRARIAATNADPRRFAWANTADQVLAGVARFCPRTSNSDP
jgi:hypothetical protein